MSLFLHMVLEKVYSFFSCNCVFFPVPLIEKTFFLPFIFLLLYHRLVGHRCLGLSLSFISCSTDLYFCFLCQYSTLLTTLSLWYSLKSGGLILPVMFFFFNITLAIWGPLCFYTNLENFCSSSVKKCHWHFDCIG